MTASKEKYDESKPSARFLVLMGLFWSGEDAGLLDLEALRTSLVSMTYAVALGTAVVATLAEVLRDIRRPPEDAGESPGTGPLWHESTMFTHPWYQVPAIFCVLILASRFVLDLMAEPPVTEKAVWFLAGLGIATLALAFGLTGGSASRKHAESQKKSEGDEALASGESESPIKATLRDPWFSVPASAIAFLHLARSGLEEIEEDPDSILATVWLLMPVAGLLAGLVSSAVSRTRQRRKEAAAVVDPHAGPDFDHQND